MLEDLTGKGVSLRHIAILGKFATLQGSVIKGEQEIRGLKGSRGCPPDLFVDDYHRLHGLVRGVYVPEEDKFALSILLTEKSSNYGRELTYFSPSKWRVSYQPPRDRRATRDVAGLRNCLDLDVPIGVLCNLRKGVNRILGLGRIIDFYGNRFSVVPLKLDSTAVKQVEDLATAQTKLKIAREDYSAPDNKTTVLARVGQEWFKDQLMTIYAAKCAFCAFSINDFLIAAHVVPYAKDRENRINPRNGILLCRMCDLAFEKSYILLREDLQIIKSEKLENLARTNASVNSWLANVSFRVKPRVPNLAPLPKFLAQRYVGI